MKKLIAWCVVMLLSISLVACGSSANNENSTGDRKIPAGVVGKDLNGETCIKEKKFGTLIEKVELTADNWQDYLHLFSYDEVTIERDAFGEIVSEYTNPVTVLGVKSSRYHTFSSHTAIELFHKETGGRKVYEFYYNGAHVDAEFDLADYEFSRIQGEIYFFDIPEEVIIRTQWGDEHGEATFKIGDSSHARTFHIITYTNTIRLWGNEFERYMN